MEQAFTTADRDRIRAALLSYAKAHRIGVPTLRARICQSTGRTRNVPSGDDPYLIDLKTLQRFLKNSHRTNDAILVPLAEFVSRFNLAAPDNVLSVALNAFFGASLPDSALSALSNPAGLVGNYEIFGPRTLFPDEANPSAPARWRGRAPASGSLLLSGSSSHFTLNVREYEYLEFSPLPEDQQSRNFCEGALLRFGAVIFAVLKNQLSQLPKTYWLRLSADGSLAGTVIEGAIRRDVDSDYVYSSSDDYLLRKIESEGP